MKTVANWKRVTLYRWRFISRTMPFNATLHDGEHMGESRDFATGQEARQWAASHDCAITGNFL